MPGNSLWALNRTINLNKVPEINLTYDVCFNKYFDEDFVDGVVISRPVTIHGNGHVLDGDGLSRIFKVSSEGVVLENLTFKNANATNGGAVYFEQSGEVKNCNFINNFAVDAGAVYFNQGGEVRNCNFTDNRAKHASAVRFNGEGNVLNSSFTNNSAESYGAVYFGQSGEVRNCNFTSNSAQFVGVVFFNGNGNVENSNLTHYPHHRSKLHHHFQKQCCQ